MNTEPKNFSEMMKIIEQKANANITIRFKLPPEKAIEVIKFVDKLMQM